MDNILVIIAFILYLGLMMSIGIYYYKKTNSMDDYINFKLLYINEDFEITEDMIFCGNGSDEVLSFVFYAFFDDNKPVVSPEFSYSFYPVYAGYYGITLAKVPLKPDFSLDTEAMLKIDSTGMIFANPNAPTGKALSLKEIEKMLETYPKDKVFVVDEAYADFSGFTVLPLLKKYKNLVKIGITR